MSGNNSTASSQETDKENAAPTDQPTTTEAPVPSSTSEPATETESAPAPPSAELDSGALPPQITSMIAEITGILNETFHTYPPHTIQRLSELVLEPRRHYKSLPAYLHAVDRVVHVTSGNNIYPLPPSIPDMRHMHINGATSDDRENSAGAGDDDTLAIWASSNNGAPIGSDEALGGALLTPIPWLARRAANGDTGSESGESSTLGSEGQTSPLAPVTVAAANSQPQQQRQTPGRGPYEMQVRTESTETIDGPNGMGSIETVSVSINGISSLSVAQQQRVITQGELIRQEQRAGVVPVSQLARNGPLIVTSSSSSASGPSSTGQADADADADTSMGEGESEAQKDTSSEKSDDEMVDDDELPHARGPDLIGAADMGPQNPTSSTFSISSGGNVEVRGIDVEAAVGRKHEAQVPSTEGEAASQSESSDDGVVLTPASSAVESAAAVSAEPSKETEETSEKQEDAKESEPKSATLSARSSPAPGKREAEDDIAETESISSKRLKGSSKEADVPTDDPTPEAGFSDAVLASEEVQPEVLPVAAERKPTAAEEDTTKDAEGDIVLTDEASPSGAANTAATGDKEALPSAAAESGTEKSPDSAPAIDGGEKAEEVQPEKTDGAEEAGPAGTAD